MANRCQMSFNFNISYHRHQGLLECQTFVTNHALFNASHSIYLFLAQWRLVLSESAVYVITGHVSHILLLFTTVITTMTMVLIYSHIVPQDI